jgi:hypothetical protein
MKFCRKFYFDLYNVLERYDFLYEIGNIVKLVQSLMWSLSLKTG